MPATCSSHSSTQPEPVAKLKCAHKEAEAILHDTLVGLANPRPVKTAVCSNGHPTPYRMCTGKENLRNIGAWYALCFKCKEWIWQDAKQELIESISKEPLCSLICERNNAAKVLENAHKAHNCRKCNDPYQMPTPAKIHMMRSSGSSSPSPITSSLSRANSSSPVNLISSSSNSNPFELDSEEYPKAQLVIVSKDNCARCITIPLFDENYFCLYDKWFYLGQEGVTHYEDLEMFDISTNSWRAVKYSEKLPNASIVLFRHKGVEF